MSATFTILGSAAGDPSAFRANASYVLDYNTHLLLFDCGSGSVSSFLKSGFDPMNIDTIFVSHLHIDHWADLLLFIQKLHLLKRTRPLIIYLPSEAILTIKNLLNASYLFIKKLPFKLELAPMEPMITLYKGNVSVNPIANRHLFGSNDIIAKSSLPNQMQCFSFLINIENKTVLYSADIESLDDIEKYMDNLDLLVIETTHIDLELLKEYSKNRSIKKIVLTHIADNSINSVKLLANLEPDKFIVAEDNLSITL